MSIEKPVNSPLNKRKLVKESPFAKLTQRTVDVGEEANKEARLVDVSRISTNPNQPRRFFDKDALDELTKDISIRGVLQPPIVRPTSDGYEIVVGERRYRAAKAAGLTQIPVIVRDLDDEQAKIISLVENIQREDLTFEDEARYFAILQQDYNYSLRDVAALVNKSKSYVDARVRLLKRPDLLEAMQADKIGLHEATLLTRLSLDKTSDGELIEKVVREKDSLPPVREKDTYASPLSAPIRQLTDLVKNSRKKILKASREEQEVIWQDIATLEAEIARLKEDLAEVNFRRR